MGNIGKLQQNIQPNRRNSTGKNKNGLSKLSHKPGLPLRPVVSMINTAEYNLAKYLDKIIIKPYIPSQFMLNSTSSFLGRLKDKNSASNQQTF